MYYDPFEHERFGRTIHRVLFYGVFLIVVGVLAVGLYTLITWEPDVEAIGEKVYQLKSAEPSTVICNRIGCATIKK